MAKPAVYSIQYHHETIGRFLAALIGAGIEPDKFMETFAERHGVRQPIIDAYEQYVASQRQVVLARVPVSNSVRMFRFDLFMRELLELSEGGERQHPVHYNDIAVLMEKLPARTASIIVTKHALGGWQEAGSFEEVGDMHNMSGANCEAAYRNGIRRLRRTAKFIARVRTGFCGIQNIGLSMNLLAQLRQIESFANTEMFLFMTTGEAKKQFELSNEQMRELIAKLQELNLGFWQ